MSLPLQSASGCLGWWPVMVCDFYSGLVSYSICRYTLQLVHLLCASTIFELKINPPKFYNIFFHNTICTILNYFKDDFRNFRGC